MANEITQDTFPIIQDLETTLLSAFMQERKLWIRMFEHIDPMYFKNGDNNRVFKILKVYFNKYKDFPTETIALSMAAKKGYEDSVQKQIKLVYKNVKSIRNDEIDFLYDECNRFIKDKKIENAVFKIIDLKEEGKYPEIEQVMREAVQWNNDINLGMQITEVRERYKQIEESYDGLIKWPWERLNAISEGMFRKQLYVNVASSSVGKTIFLDNVAFFTWNNLKKNVVSITLEVSELKKCQRMDAYGTKIPLKQLVGQKDKVIKFYEDDKKENRLFVKEFPTGKATVEHHIMGYLYNLELYAGLHPRDIDLIVVDYGDILKPSKVFGNMYKDTGGAYESLRSLAQELNVPVLTAGQLNRSVVQYGITVEELNESTMGESFIKYQIADWMLAMINTPEERAKGRINFKVLKDREGQKDIILPMNVDYPCLRIYDNFDSPIPESDDEEVGE